MTTIAVVAFNRSIADEWQAKLANHVARAVVGTDQQQDIWQAMASADHHIIVRALAGTGKSFTMEHGALTCFTEPNVVALTCHSLGNSALYAAGMGGKPDGRKSYRILDAIAPRISQNAKQQAVKLAGLAKGNLIAGDDTAALDALAAHHGLELNGDAHDVYAIMPDLLATCQDTKRWGIDFDDMIWLPAVLNLPPRRYDVLMVDEAQDLNRAQHALVLAAIAGSGGPIVKLGGKSYAPTQPGRLIAVGDENQAIYGFRGADADSMATLEATLAGTARGVQSFPLTMTRRCPVAVVNIARQLVPTFEALPDAPMGEVLTNGAPLRLEAGQECPTCHYLTCQCPGGPTKYPTTPQRGDMVLCRTNAPLIAMAYTLIRADVPCKIQGRDFGANLAAFIGKLVRKRDDATTDELIRELEAWATRERTNIMAEKFPSDQKLIALEDRVECVTALASGLATVGDVIAKVNTLFADIDAGAPHSAFVLLSSVHRAKGMESPIVRILEPEKMPHPMARQPWERNQERNLAYVAITRAQHTLIFHGQPGCVRLPE